MGNDLVPPFAIIFMDKLERSMLASAEHQPEFNDRYVDDCLMTWVHGERALVSLHLTRIQDPFAEAFKSDFAPAGVRARKCLVS